MQIQVIFRILTARTTAFSCSTAFIDEIEARRVPLGKRPSNRVLFFPIERTMHHRRRRRRSSLPKIDQSERRESRERVRWLDAKAISSRRTEMMMSMCVLIGFVSILSFLFLE